MQVELFMWAREVGVTDKTHTSIEYAAAVSSVSDGSGY
jgi:hypothetical protein